MDIIKKKEFWELSLDEFLDLIYTKGMNTFVIYNKDEHKFIKDFIKSKLDMTIDAVNKYPFVIKINSNICNRSENYRHMRDRNSYSSAYPYKGISSIDVQSGNSEVFVLPRNLPDLNGKPPTSVDIYKQKLMEDLSC